MGGALAATGVLLVILNMPKAIKVKPEEWLRKHPRDARQPPARPRAEVLPILGKDAWGARLVLRF